MSRWSRWREQESGEQLFGRVSCFGLAVDRVTRLTTAIFASQAVYISPLDRDHHGHYIDLDEGTRCVTRPEIELRTVTSPALAFGTTVS